MPASDQGVRSDRNLVIRRSLVFLFDSDSVLLIKGAPDKRLWAGKYNGIGGHIEEGEETLIGTNRELFEETGIEGVRLDLNGTIAIDTGNPPGILIAVFSGDYDKSADLHSSHEGCLEWYELKDVPNLPVVEDIPVLLEQVIRSREERKTFFGYYWYDGDGKLKTKFHNL